jgi:hypothetical protein
MIYRRVMDFGSGKVGFIGMDSEVLEPTKCTPLKGFRGKYILPKCIRPNYLESNQYFQQEICYLCAL